jgi:hypothetical protein
MLISIHLLPLRFLTEKINVIHNTEILFANNLFLRSKFRKIPSTGREIHKMSIGSPIPSPAKLYLMTDFWNDIFKFPSN